MAVPFLFTSAVLRLDMWIGRSEEKGQGQEVALPATPDNCLKSLESSSDCRKPRHAGTQEQKGRGQRDRTVTDGYSGDDGG